MLLDTISSRDTGQTKFKIVKNQNYSLMTDDIRGAKTDVYGYKYFNKECFINRKEDIDGTASK